MADAEWARSQNAAWRDLSDSVITGWSGLDVDVSWEGAGTYLDKSSPFMQLSSLRINREGAGALDFCTHQIDATFGLSVKPSEGQPLHGYGGWRESDLRHLPTGRVQRLELHLDTRKLSEGGLMEVLLTIGGRGVLLVAAEIVDLEANLLSSWGNDELMLFSDPHAVETVRWGEPREYSTIQIRRDDLDDVRLGD